jgi:hypothetical protein
MKSIFTWFRYVDDRLWGGETDCNRYLSSLMLLFALLSGAVLGSLPLSVDIIPFLADVNIVSVTALMVYVAGITVCESICMAHNATVALLRSILLVVSVFVLYGAGYAVSSMVTGLFV